MDNIISFMDSGKIKLIGIFKADSEGNGVIEIPQKEIKKLNIGEGGTINVSIVPKSKPEFSG